MSRAKIAVSGAAIFFVALLFLLMPARNEYGLRKKMAFEDTTSYVRGQVVVCLKSGEATWRGRCFRELGELLSSQFLLPQSLAALSAIDSEEGIKQQCHALVHYLGQNEYKRQGDLAATFRSCLSSPVACGEGCFHGAVEGYVSEHGGELKKESASSVCDVSFTENQVTYDACVHGLGHAFMLQFNGDIYASLDSCRVLSRPSDREFCYAGVFMENVFSFWNPEHGSKYIRPEDPAYPCTTLSEEYQKSCYASQASFVINMSLRPDFMPAYDDAVAFCSSVPEFAQAECYSSVGSNIVVSTDDSAIIVKACELTPAGEPRSLCFKEALTFIGHGSGGDIKSINKLCEFVENKPDRVTCDAWASHVAHTWAPFEKSN